MDQQQLDSQFSLLKKRELEMCIDTCKELILENLNQATDDNEQKNKHLVKELIELRRQLHELKEEDSSSNDVHVMFGHKFCAHDGKEPLPDNSTSPRVRRYCDKCGDMIWSFLQSWYKCKYCGIYSHAKCLNLVTRSCAYFKANEEPIYELNICPESGLAAQKYRCSDCRTKLNIDPDNMQFSPSRLCDYDGLYYCPACHWADLSVIPARIVRNWDFEPMPVSRRSKQFLRVMQKKPILLFEALNPNLFSYIKELRTIKALRQELLLIKPYMLSCREASNKRLFSLIKDYPHFFDSSEAYSIQDLVDLNEGILESKLRAIIQTYIKHIKIDCETCRGNGFVCEFCFDDQILFPFDELIVSCRKCRTVYHRLCFEQHDGQCPRCVRRTSRQSVSLTNSVKKDESTL